MNVAFLGLGRRSVGFLERLAQTEGMRISAGADTWEAARKHAERRCRGMQTYESANKLFDRRRDIDLAMIFSRDCEHETHALTALANGADVFVEKPMALTPEGCRRMIEAAERAGRRMMVGFNLRFHPTVREAKRFVDEGRLGRLRAIWEWHEVDLNYFHNWMSIRANSGGLLFQKGCHDFDLFNWFAGCVPVKVSAFGGLAYYGGDRPDDLTCPGCPDRETCTEATEGRVFPPGDSEGVENAEQMKCAFRREIDVCDSHVANLLFEDGAQGSYTEIHGSPRKQRRFVLFGAKGRLDFDIHGGGLSWRPRGREDAAKEWSPDPETGGHGGGDTALMDSIIAVFRDGAAVPVTGKDGMNAVRVSHAAESALLSLQVTAV